MTNSSPSGSERVPPTRSSSFELLHRGVQEWIWERGWRELRDAQERAIPVLLPGDRDLVIAASTAAGKTEAAFLPILSRLARDGASSGVAAIYVGPLKALINDQFGRLDELCERLDIAVHRWHGDVDGGRKRAVIEDPSGVLLITPESLEGLFIRRGAKLRGIFASLRYVVVDELHTFLGTERGKQLQSQLARLELLLGRRVARVGLSATLGDMDLARAALRPEDPASVALVQSPSGGQELRVQVRGVRGVASPDDTEPAALQVVADHLFRTMRGSRNLVFANARRVVEELSDRLRQRCEDEHVPVEFVAHHGSLARAWRQDVEADLRDGDRPCTVICTATLELGIDIGAVKSVAQIGAPSSVAALRQRLGRSGRRKGEPAVLRIYAIDEIEPEADDPLADLAPQVVQAVAMVQLLVQGFCEPPRADAVHASTLVQQTLSVIAQEEGAKAQHLHAVLCRHGAFRAIDAAAFARFLRGLAAQGLIEQEADGTLLLGPEGESLVGDWTFYAAFEQAEEFAVQHDGAELGRIMLDPSIRAGELLVLGGRRWIVLGVEGGARRVVVEPAVGAGRARFMGRAPAGVHDRVREEMQRVWMGAVAPDFVDPVAREIVERAQRRFVELGLHARSCVDGANGAILFVPCGDRVIDTVQAMLGVPCDVDGPFLGVEQLGAAELLSRLRALAEAPAPDVAVLLGRLHGLPAQKHDRFVEPELLMLDRAARHLDIDGARAALRALR